MKRRTFMKLAASALPALRFGIPFRQSVQSIAAPPRVIGGTFTLSYRGHKSTLPYNATAADIKRALENLNYLFGEGERATRIS